MTPDRSAARKKARWSTAQKVEARKGRRPGAATSGVGKPVRRADGPAGGRYAGAPDRAERGGGQWRTSAGGARDERADRREDRAGRRDDRATWRDERGYRSGDRSGRPAERFRRSDGESVGRRSWRDDRDERRESRDGRRDDRRDGRRDDRRGRTQGAAWRDDRRTGSDRPRRDGADEGQRPTWRDARGVGDVRDPRDNRETPDGRHARGAGPRRPGFRAEWHERSARDLRDRRDVRDDRSGQGDRPSRGDAPRRYETPRRHDTPRRYDAPRRNDPHAERMRRVEPVRRDAPDRGPVVDPPVEAGNGFAALGLPEVLVRRLARDGITAPFPIQEATIPDALAGRDVLGRGRTGSGKTLAFGLPTLARLAADGPAEPKRPAALVLVPTRELAMQVSDALEPLAHVAGVRHKLVAGGLAYTGQIAALERGVDLLIATPGRLVDLVDRGAVSLDRVRYAILDEADHMAEMGFLPDVTALLDMIPPGGQRLLFSATLDKGIDELVERYLTDPVEHATDAATASVTTMAHHVLLVEPAHKKLITAQVANRDGRTIVFVRTKLGADRVAREIREQGVLAAALHGGLNQGARNRVLAAFKDGRMPVLVATDVAARGIHVDEVSVVLQVDPPADPKDYLHRAGRTARAGEQGAVVTLALPHQRRGMERLCATAGVDVTPVVATPGDDALLAATGARRTSGVPVPEEAYLRIVEGPPRRRGPRPGPGGPRRRTPRDGDRRRARDA